MSQRNGNNGKNVNNSNNWRSKQNLIKDVLSKSGTELMEITTTASPPNKTPNGSAKTVGRRVKQKRNGGDTAAGSVTSKGAFNYIVYIYKQHTDRKYHTYETFRFRFPSGKAAKKLQRPVRARKAFSLFLFFYTVTHL